jgi:integrase
MVTFTEYAARWQHTRSDKAPATQDRDASYLRALILPTFGERTVGAVTTSDVAVWVANLDRADATRSKALQIVRGVLDLARRDRAIATNPATDVASPGTEPERVGRALSDDEVTAILDAAELVDEATAPIALQRSDLELNSGILSVRRSMNRRGQLVPVKGRQREDQGRRLPIPADLIDRLRRHLALDRLLSLDGLLVTSPHGSPIRYPNWRKRTWGRIVTESGVSATPHDLRRTCATRLIIEDRWSPAEVQTFLGHRDPRVTLQIYTMIAADDLPTPSSMPR